MRAAILTGPNGVAVRSENDICMTGRKTPHRVEVGASLERSDDEADAIEHLYTRVAFIKALSAGDTFVLIFLTRENARLGAAQIDTTLLKAPPGLSDRAFEEAARIQKARKMHRDENLGLPDRLGVRTLARPEDRR